MAEESDQHLLRGLMYFIDAIFSNEMNCYIHLGNLYNFQLANFLRSFYLLYLCDFSGVINVLVNICYVFLFSLIPTILYYNKTF